MAQQLIDQPHHAAGGTVPPVHPSSSRGKKSSARRESRPLPVTRAAQEHALRVHARSICGYLRKRGIFRTAQGNMLTIANVMREEREQFMHRLQVRLEAAGVDPSARPDRKRYQTGPAAKKAAAEAVKKPTRPWQEQKAAPSRSTDKRRQRREQAQRLASVRETVGDAQQMAGAARQMLRYDFAGDAVRFLRPHVTGTGRSRTPELNCLLGLARLRTGDYGRAAQAADPVLADPAWGQLAHAIFAVAAIGQERPFLATELAAHSGNHVLQQAARLSVALMSDDAPAAARALHRLGPLRPVYHREHWSLRISGLMADTPPLQIRLAPASLAKSLTLAEAYLINERGDLALSEVFNTVRAPRQPESARDHGLLVQAHTLRAQANMAMARRSSPVRADEYYKAAFKACDAAIQKRPTDSDLLRLAAEIVDESGLPEQRVQLAGFMARSRTIPAAVRTAAETPDEKLLPPLDRELRERALAKVERPSHRPSPAARRFGHSAQHR